MGGYSLDKYTVLKHYFGYQDFRPGQEVLIDAILSGRDVLGVMPTGGGKSMCYQIPALVLPGVTLVVSPLISLMKDQVAALKNAGVAAAFINSTLTPEQLRLVYRRARSGAYKLIYIAPERLGGEGFSALAREMPISLVAVDEAHCISQWGQDFRPSYLEIADFIRTLPDRPVVAAFTATATAQVRQDIMRLLELQNPACQVTGFDRPNLFFDVRSPADKRSALLSLLRERRDKSGIVYCSTRAGVERMEQMLREAGFAATRYHAGLEEAERQANQEDFQFDRKTIMVATNAFGMGIDKSNVSFVIHYNMPKSLEAYYQEAGRAGRDGAAADCILLFSARDIVTAKFLIENSGSDALTEEEQASIRRAEQRRLKAMVGYCRTTRCLRGYILDYFGQEHPDACGSCGNCKRTFLQQDVTTEAQMALSCVYRIKQQLGYWVGRTLVVQVLRGSTEQRLRSLGLDRLSTYGLMRSRTAGQVRNLLDFLELEGYLRTNPAHETLEPTSAASAVLFEGKEVVMPLRIEAAAPDRARRRGKADLSGVPTGEGSLYDALRETRSRLAREESVPAYVVFSNATLADMAEKAPRTMAELLRVSGVGEVKARRYGAAFLEAIRAYQNASETTSEL